MRKATSEEFKEWLANPITKEALELLEERSHTSWWDARTCSEVSEILIRSGHVQGIEDAITFLRRLAEGDT